MSEFVFTLARPRSARDCVADPFLPLVRGPLWVGYLTFGHRYLADVNDDPDLDEQYDAGLALWVERVRGLLDVVLHASDGRPVQVSVHDPSSAKRFVERLTGRADPGWTVRDADTVDLDLLEGLATYGGERTIWTVLPDGHGDFAGASLVSRLEAWIREGAGSCWVGHGYKEPFLVGQTPTLGIDALADVIRARLGIPVSLTAQVFVPHRVRMHQRFT